VGDRYNLFVFEIRALRIIYGSKRNYSLWTDDSNESYKLYIVFFFVKTSGGYAGDHSE
jgi:hypothetical protein